MGRAWTRKSIEELVEDYLRIHGGGGTLPTIRNMTPFNAFKGQKVHYSVPYKEDNIIRFKNIGAIIMDPTELYLKRNSSSYNYTCSESGIVSTSNVSSQNGEPTFEGELLTFNFNGLSFHHSDMTDIRDIYGIIIYVQGEKGEWFEGGPKKIEKLWYLNPSGSRMFSIQQSGTKLTFTGESRLYPFVETFMQEKIGESIASHYDDGDLEPFEGELVFLCGLPGFQLNGTDFGTIDGRIALPHEYGAFKGLPYEIYNE